MEFTSLTHPTDIDAGSNEPDHPITDLTVERAHRMVASGISVETINTHLETIQTSFEHTLADGTGRQLYDPMELFGKSVHKMKTEPHKSQYADKLFIEDTRTVPQDKDARLTQLARKQAVEEYEKGTEFSVEEFGARVTELKTELDLADFSEEEQKGAFGPRFGIWKSVATLLNLDQTSEEFKAVRLAHELLYDENMRHNIDHSDTGFVVGIPPLFRAGMRAEQRLFSELTSTRMPPAQLVDAYGSRVSYRRASKWASKRGVSKSTVSQNRSKARKTLSEKYPRGTYPDSLGVSEDY